MLKRISCVFLIPLLLALSVLSAQADNTRLDALYKAAIEDARIATADEISRELTGISSPDNKNIPSFLIWKEINGSQHVLMATWAGKYISSRNWKPGETIQLAATTNIWVTACPELRDFFRDRGFWPGSHDKRVLRIEQLLGLPRNDGNMKFIEFWVKPADLFRPAADPDPTDHEAQLVYPWKNRPFYQMSQARKIHEYVNADTPDREMTYEEWFENLNATSYTDQTPYPWTRLGYTYDWADDKYNNGHIGLSEFIVLGGSSIVIERTVETENLESYFTKP